MKVTAIIIANAIAAIGLAACSSTVVPTARPATPTPTATVAPTPSATPTATPTSTPAQITPTITVTACDPVGTAGGGAIAWSGSGNVYYQLTITSPSGTPTIVYVNVHPSGTYGPLTEVGTWHYQFQADDQQSVSGTFTIAACSG
jgi:hypothetical protein